MNTIIWKGVPSTSIDGLLICELPTITKPPLRVKETAIDGRDGSIIEELGYSTYNKSLTIGLHGAFNIDKVIKYFSGEGEIIFSNEPDKVYTAKIINQVDYNRLLRFRQAVVTFRVQPFKHKYNEAHKAIETATATATATGTNVVLKDSGNTPLSIRTQAESMIVHGKNILNANAFELNTNTSINVYDNGYKIVARGGALGKYTSSNYYLPLQMKGKRYTLMCDNVIDEQEVDGGVQLNIVTTSGTKYYGIYAKSSKFVDFEIQEDAISIQVSIYSNNRNVELKSDNTVIVLGLRIVPEECKNDAWCAFDGLQTLEVVDGVADATGYDSATVISNADNVDMTVEYFKRFDVFNEGLENSKPKMVLHGSGTVGISANGIHIFDYTFPEGETEVVIDSEKQDAYLGSVLKNRNMNGEFPVLLAGSNTIGWSGDVESIEVLPRSRWL